VQIDGQLDGTLEHTVYAKEVQMAERHELLADKQVLIVDFTPIREEKYEKGTNSNVPFMLHHKVKLDINGWQFGSNTVYLRAPGAEQVEFIFQLQK